MDEPSSPPAKRRCVGTFSHMPSVHCEEDNASTSHPIKRRSAGPKSSDKSLQHVVVCLSTVKEGKPGFLDLPPEVVENILRKLNSHAEVARLRLVCRHFRDTGQNILNKSFTKVQEVIQARLQVIKSQMPRRESSRRKHPLARECDIMETLRMRLVLMQMTFGKHIEKGHCCFFAGEILDEILHILQYTKTAAVLGRVCKVTDELFDLSTMAMEYFKEHVEPGLPPVTYFSSDFSFSTPTTTKTSLSPLPDEPDTTPSFPTQFQSSPEIENKVTYPIIVRKSRTREALKSTRRYVKKVNANVTLLRREVRSSKVKLAYLNRQMVEYTARLEQYDRRFDEQSKKMEAMVKELSQCRAELSDLKGSKKETD